MDVTAPSALGAALRPSARPSAVLADVPSASASAPAAVLALATVAAPVAAVVSPPALRAAAATLGRWRLDGCTLYVTLEPCAMCAGALVLARVDRVVFGAWDPKAGACGSVWDIPRDRRATHRCEVVGGVREAECAALLLDFFEGQRKV